MDHPSNLVDAIHGKAIDRALRVIGSGLKPTPIVSFAFATLCQTSSMGQ
jgi:hypothetical protein